MEKSAIILLERMSGAYMFYAGARGGYNKFCNSWLCGNHTFKRQRITAFWPVPYWVTTATRVLTAWQWLLRESKTDKKSDQQSCDQEFGN